MLWDSNIFITLTAKQYELAAVGYKTLEFLYRAGLEGINPKRCGLFGGVFWEK